MATQPQRHRIRSRASLGGGGGCGGRRRPQQVDFLPQSVGARGGAMQLLLPIRELAAESGALRRRRGELRPERLRLTRGSLQLLLPRLVLQRLAHCAAAARAAATLAAAALAAAARSGGGGGGGALLCETRLQLGVLRLVPYL